MAAKPAELVGLTSKGKLALGYNADLTVFAPDSAYIVDPHQLHHKNKVSPYADHSLSGLVRRTFLNDREIDVTSTPHGLLLRRGAIDQREMSAASAQPKNEEPSNEKRIEGSIESRSVRIAP